MFARVSYARYPPEHRQAGLQVVLGELLPAFRRVAGYRGCWLLEDGRPGTGLSLVLWETEEAADAAAVDAAVSACRTRLARLGVVMDSRQIYEVLAHDGW